MQDLTSQTFRFNNTMPLAKIFVKNNNEQYDLPASNGRYKKCKTLIFSKFLLVKIARNSLYKPFKPVLGLLALILKITNLGLLN